MADLTRDAVLDRARRGAKLERTDLQGLDLSKGALAKAALNRSDLNGANLEGADLSSASLKRATLREAYMVGANLTNANLENADLEGAKLERAILHGANLTRANLEGAVLTGADLTGARLSYAQLASAKLGGANLTDCVLANAELDDAYLGGAKLERAQLGSASLIHASLEEANLTGADLRHATLSGARIANAKLTGAKIAGMVGTGADAPVDAQWLDDSPNGDGASKVEGPQILAALSGRRPPVADGNRRYFGRGDVLRNATLQFDGGARVEIDSLFDNCTINLGEGTELVVGEVGVLADCEIIGAGNITVHGKFFERQSPGIIGPRRVHVSAKGAVVAAIAQHADLTRFAFERGCQLRMKVVEPRANQKVEAKS